MTEVFMRKIQTVCLSFFLFLLFLFSPAVPTAAEAKEVYLGGMPAGFSLRLNGVQIVGISDIVCGDKVVSPARDARLQIGDLICSLNGSEIDSVSDLEKEVSSGNKMQLCYLRGNQKMSTVIEPVLDSASSQYRIGVLIRDSVSGVGTITCIDAHTYRFGSLGHPVLDESRQKMEIAQSVVYRCSIIGVNKGVRGKAGELRGIFIKANPLGVAKQNSDTGIFGVYDAESTKGLEKIMTAPISEAMPGKAEIITTVDGFQAERYRIELVKVDECNKENKNFVLKITDQRLLSMTGGIVQGMSGSPILQNGKLIGAVTHVFLNDPTRGYGIGIEKMFGT